MRSLWCFAFVLGCQSAPATHAQPPAVCKAPRPTDGFSPIATASGVQFVAPADDPLAAEIFTYAAKTLPGIELRRPEEADLTKNLVVFGRFETNKLVAELNRTGAIAFQRGKFQFGGHVYADANDGIAVILPSPFAPQRFVVAYVGNSPAGLLMTQSVPTGGHQFTVVGNPIGVQQEGDFCDGRYYAPYATDARADWEAYRATLAHRDTPHHVIYFEQGTLAAKDIDTIARGLEEDYAHILNTLAVPGLDHPIVTYLWSDRAKKKRLTGDEGNGRAIGDVVHAMYAPGVNALGPHEYVHVVAEERLGAPPIPVLTEGLAVAVDKTWQGEPLQAVVRKLGAAGTLPTLDKLTCCFRNLDDNLTYPTAGDLVDYLIERFGIEAFKRLYGAKDPLASLHEILGVDATTLEDDWRRSRQLPPH